MNNLSLLELPLCVKNKKSYSDSFVGYLDASLIQGIFSTSIKFLCLIKYQNIDYYSFGNFRTLNNRWVYALEKKKDIYQDPILRPSISILHAPQKIQVDSVFFDDYQIYSFISVLKPELLKTEQIKNLFYLKPISKIEKDLLQLRCNSQSIIGKTISKKKTLIIKC